jgi:hypothetical protein
MTGSGHGSTVKVSTGKTGSVVSGTLRAPWCRRVSPYDDDGRGRSGSASAV